MRPGDGTSPTDTRQQDAPPTSLTLSLPSGVADVVRTAPPAPTTEDRMDLVLRLAAANVASGGGPFAAALFTTATGELLAGGVNLVVPASVPVAHAEIVAFALAGRRLGTFDLTVHGPVELVTSCEPCAMCLGAVPWAGVTRVVSGARDADARSIGFDEGDKPADWADALRRRGIEVVEDVRRDAAVEVLQSYVRAGGVVYNGTGSA
jgi:tRNA(Arg) A34 adenosine deaminase TadA